MGHISKSMNDIGAECGLRKCDGLAHEVENNNIWPQDHSCDILLKHMAAAFLSLNSLPEAKQKRQNQKD